MDQQALKELEFRCIQEEPPWCTAACPLHVDVRVFLKHIQQDRWEDAGKVLRKFMPLPGILGRICDAPCEKRCKRTEIDAAVCIGALERACVQFPPPAMRIMPLPAKGKTVAVIGSGVSGLTAAWDLARKGYTVTVFETGDKIGANLRQRHPHRLPPEVIEQEAAVLIQLGITFELGCNPDPQSIAEKCRSSFDATFLGLDVVRGDGWDLERDACGKIRVDGKSGQTARTGLFAGGQTDSPVWQAAQGRWAATSIDRFLQNVSITAGRDREGPFETRLFTSTANVLSLPAVVMSDPGSGFSRSEALAEAGRCLQCECMACVGVCTYLEQFRGYPKKYAREIYNNLSIVMGEHKANSLINSCSLCGLCEQVCPNRFPMQDICLQARQTQVKTGKMPASAHEFALLDMAFSQSDLFAMARHQAGYETSAYMFFPGCQLCASAPEQVDALYAHLRSALSAEETGGIGLMLGCCAAPAHWSGNKELFETHLAHIKTQWANLGHPVMILACSTCMRIFSDHLPMIPAISVWSTLEKNPPSAITTGISGSLAIHDPCTTRFDTDMQSCVRRLLADAGITAQELSLNHAETECCGFGGLMQNANPELARKVVRRRAERSHSDYVTYCAMCRDNLAAAGKRVIHVLDIYFPDPRHPDPALRPRPGWSQRQENRARLKSFLLKTLWNEVPDHMDVHPDINLELSPEVEAELDNRRILMEDLRQVIRHAEASGERLFNPHNGHYKAAYCPRKVTFWVEYTPAGEKYVIHNAYAHRMEVLGP